MLRRLTLPALAVLMASASVGAGQAADLPGPLALPELTPASVAEFGSGWYLRGDVGYVQYEDVSTSVVGNTGALTSTIDDVFSVGLGFGTEFTNWFRADVTFDYRAPADIALGGSCIGCGIAFNGATTSLESYLLMANAYLDLGTWWRVTPYVGAGIGTAYNKLDTLTLSPSAPTTIVRGSGDWDLAWALMAGAAFDITGNWKVDAGYRYADLGEVESEVGTNFAALTLNNPVVVDDITSHEFRIGFRYLID